mmetsp:Transcript_26289/g.28290  ORF Transcript_26289/g.28290 Transcript_26289/m.28290 type:complete len:201 (+) Transcript_26289:414-1016(+)
MKKTSWAHRRSDTKLLSNQCGFIKTIFDRKQQDTHTYFVCNAPKEDRNHMFSCQGPSAINNWKRNLKELQKEMEDLETTLIITRTIIKGLKHVHNGSTPSAYSFSDFVFEGGITISGIIRDLADIGWINFLCRKWSVKWKGAQKIHYLRINKKKSACFWTIAILKKLLMIHGICDSLETKYCNHRLVQHLLPVTTFLITE